MPPGYGGTESCDHAMSALIVEFESKHANVVATSNFLDSRKRRTVITRPSVVATFRRRLAQSRATFRQRMSRFKESNETRCRSVNKMTTTVNHPRSRGVEPKLSRNEASGLLHRLHRRHAPFIPPGSHGG